MKRPSQGDYAQAQKLRGIFVLYLWLSVAICVSASVVIVATGQGEDAKWLASGLFAFGMVGAAFARAVPKLRQPRWWIGCSAPS